MGNTIKEMFKIATVCVFLSSGLLTVTPRGIKLKDIKENDKEVVSEDTEKKDKVKDENIDNSDQDNDAGNKKVVYTDREEIACSPPYYIKVNRKMNTVTVYNQDNNGDFTVPVKSMVCSVGEMEKHH